MKKLMEEMIKETNERDAHGIKVNELEARFLFAIGRMETDGYDINTGDIIATGTRIVESATIISRRKK